MRIVHLSASGKNGGAAQAARRLHEGMREAGVNSVFFSRDHEDPSQDCHLLPTPPSANQDSTPSPLEEQLRSDLSKVKIFDSFSGIDSPFAGLTEEHPDFQADLLVLHWLAGTLPWSTFFAKGSHPPILWRLPDIYPLTGGCHYPNACEEYTQAQGCADCPYGVRRDVVAAQFAAKQEAFAKVASDRLTFVAQSRWIQRGIKRSSLGQKFQVAHIPNGVDTQICYPEDPSGARKSLNLPSEARIGLIVGPVHSQRKGARPLLELLPDLPLPPDFRLMIVGGGDSSLAERVQRRPDVIWFDHADAAQLRRIYSATDWLLFPSLQDNCPNVVLEAQACHLPVLAFKNSGTQELIRHRRDGILVPDRNYEKFGSTLVRLMSGKLQVSHTFRSRSREECVQDYLELARKVIAGHGT